MSQTVPDLPPRIAFGNARSMGHPAVRRAIRTLEAQCAMFRDGWIAAERRNAGVAQ